LVATGNGDLLAVLHTYADDVGEITLQCLRLRDLT